MVVHKLRWQVFGFFTYPLCRHFLPYKRWNKWHFWATLLVNVVYEWPLNVSAKIWGPGGSSPRAPRLQRPLWRDTYVWFAQPHQKTSFFPLVPLMLFLVIFPSSMELLVFDCGKFIKWDWLGKAEWFLNSDKPYAFIEVVSKKQLLFFVGLFLVPSHQS